MVKTVLEWIQLIGIPSIFAIILYCVRKVTKLTKKMLILQAAQKAQMRAQLLEKYEFYKNQGYVAQVELDEWMNQYKAYHELVGENEILDDRKDNLKKFPNSPTLNIKTTGGNE